MRENMFNDLLRFIIVCSCLALGVVTLACGAEAGSEDDVVVEPTLNSIQNEVFEVSCNFEGCHATSAEGSAGNLTLESNTAYAQLVGVEASQGEAAAMGLVRVVPGSADESFLVIKLEGEFEDSLGDPMPQFSSSLEQSQIDAIREWIDKGAPETE